MEYKTIGVFDKFCYHCLIKGKTQQQFKFTLKKNIDFNYEIIIDVMYLDRLLVFNAIDTATTF